MDEDSIFNELTFANESLGTPAVVRFNDYKGAALDSIEGTIVVPAVPAASGGLRVGPLVGPRGNNYLPIDWGVITPSLRWGNALLPEGQSPQYSSWDALGFYFNGSGKAQGFMGQQGGQSLPIGAGARLRLRAARTGTAWEQTATDLEKNKSVSFTLDMKGQDQGVAIFSAQGNGPAVGDYLLTDIIIRFSAENAANCQLNTRGPLDEIGTIQLSASTRVCKIDSIKLRMGS